MEISLSPKIDTDINNVCGIFIKIENPFSTPIKHKNTTIKCTRISDYEFENKVSWPQRSYTRLRRFTTLDNEEHKTSRSVKSDITFPSKMTSVLPKRKIVTIAEDDENDLHPRFTRKIKKSCSVKTLNSSVATDYKDEKCLSTRSVSTASKLAKDVKKSKINNAQVARDINVLKPVNSRKGSKINSERLEHGKSENTKDNGLSSNIKNTNISKTSMNKHIVASNHEKEIATINSKLFTKLRPNISVKKPVEKSRTDNSFAHINSKRTFLKELQSKNKPVTVIHVPLDEKYNGRKMLLEDNSNVAKTTNSCEISNVKELKNMNVGTDPIATVDQVTDMSEFEFQNIESFFKSTRIQTEMTKEIFDKLEIPNVSLKKEKNDVKEIEESVDYKSHPNIQISSLSLSSDKVNNNKKELNYCTSYIISTATLTCTTQRKINFHVESKDTDPMIQSSNPLSYPLSVVSLLRNEINKNKQSNKEKFVYNIEDRKSKSETEEMKYLKEHKPHNSFYPNDNNKLMKPSEIIRSIKFNTEILQSEYVSEQFLRELNFIDSFYESLQYLENTSLSTNCLINKNIDNITCNSEFFTNVFKAKTSEYDRFLSKLNNNCNVDNTETMTSKSLCLLNSLIRDEQRRAKNLLFVLKMREDALKNFATSQILWLENKKKHDNTDVSVLKKKQRGALLKLQHECGEMQRMRKALLTLSEKRKTALMKTKKSLELKLKNNVDVDQIVLGKKKLKKSISLDRNTAPLKCFDLSSSGCEESSTSRYNTDNAVFDPDFKSVVTSVKSAEKSIQTGDSIIESLFVNESTDAAAENFVVVDGSYLNILFQNLSLPHMFSGGKKYEVNEEALKNIVNSSNSRNSNITKDSIIEKFIYQSNNIQQDSDRSASPSTARSLVEEFDCYYKSLEEKSPEDFSDQELPSPGIVYEVKDIAVQFSPPEVEKCSNPLFHSASTLTTENCDNNAASDNVPSIDQLCMCEAPDLSVELVPSLGKEDITMLRQTGPLTVPVGASAQTDISGVEGSVRPVIKTTASTTVSENSEDSKTIGQSIPSMTLTSPVHCEVEELRRQQLAIEREIKALEQQQCQLLVVREIPDKPPPPYTPPADSKPSKSPRKFIADEKSKEKIKKLILDPSCSAVESNDSFDLFVKDFCHESLERQRLEQSEKPWDACNLLPQKQSCDMDKLVQRTSSELSEVLTGVTPTVVSGVGARRSDHIDDILFAEWRRCEPEWTSLHTDEASVKNQIFDSIFQKILTETVDEYKKIVKDDVTTKS